MTTQAARFDSNRPHKFVRQGCLIVALLAAASLANSVAEGRPQGDINASGQHGYAQSQHPASDQAGAPPSSEQPEAVVVPKEEQPRAAIYQVACDKPKDREEADLCEQRRMADAARLQIGLSIFGFVAILATLAFTAAATLAASRAAAAATRQAKIAEASFNMLERPYLSIFGVHKFAIDNTRAGGKAPTITYTIANYGKTPAIIENARIAVGITNTGRPGTPKRITRDNNLFTSPTFGPNEKRDYLRQPVDDRAIFSDWKIDVPSRPPGHEFYFWIVIRYRGPFSKGHGVSACWRYDDATKSLIRYRGNRYNRETQHPRRRNGEPAH